MLQKLTIRNYALIDSVDLELDKGLNIITGETGAGKSIMLGALSLILGQRAETKYFFNQEKKCVIEGVFALQGENLQNAFEEHDLDFYSESIFRREISTDGKSRSFINDTPVTLSVMKQLGEKLIDIHSQHATLEIADPAFQLLMVDVLAGHPEILTTYRKEYKQYRKLQQQLEQLKTAAAEARSRQDYEQYLFDELEAAALKDGEQEELEAEQELLSNAESIKRNLLTSHYLISEQETAVLPVLREAIQSMQVVEKFSPAYEALNERMRSVQIELKDIAAELSAMEQDVAFQPSRIEEIGLRLDTLYGLQQKHRVATVAELMAFRDELSTRLLDLVQGDEQIEKLEQEIASLNISLESRAELLSKNRSAAIRRTESQVAELLTQVEMPNARIQIDQSIQAELNKDGKDQISLLFSANNGQAPAPVGKVASGGELSRLMLAIKSILAQHTALPTLIFDEIDTGISGETALKVGQVIGRLGENMQVICITHLPQIAAKGESHYFVHKKDEGERTTTGIRKLVQAERVQAIAEMLSGKSAGASALKNAEELLKIS